MIIASGILFLVLVFAILAWMTLSLLSNSDLFDIWEESER